MENIRNQDLTSPREILIVSFGTSFAKTRAATIGAIEEEAARTFPDWEVRRAFTSGMVIRHIEKSEGLRIDSAAQALERAARCGVSELVIAPTHLMSGNEYEKILAAADAHRGSFDRLSISAPLLTSDEDFDGVSRAVCEMAKKRLAGEKKSAALFMGHGTDALSNRVYARIGERMHALGYEDAYVATVEGTPTLADVLPELTGKGYGVVLLSPLMVVAGDHANNDLAGDGEDSWKTVLEHMGFETIPVLRGLGEYPEIRKIYMDHIRSAAG